MNVDSRDATASKEEMRDEHPPRSGAAFSLLATVQLTLIMAITMLSVALPRIEAELGLSTSRLTLVNAAYGLSFSGLLLLGGRAADLYGRRRLFTAGVAVFGAASLAAGIAPEFRTLLISRFLQGAGAALAAPAAMALLGSVFPDPNRRSRAMAVWGGLSPMGAAVGTLASGAVSTWFSWRWTFAIPAIVSVVALALSRALLPEGSADTRARLDVKGAVLVTAGLTTLSYGLVHAAERPWTSAMVLGPILLSVLLLGLFAVLELRTPDPLLPMDFLRSAHRAAGLWVILAAATGISTVFMLMSLYFQQVAGMSPLRTAAAFLPFSVTLAVAGTIVAHLVRWFGARTVVVVGSLLAAAGLWLLGRAEADSPYVGALLAGLLVLPVGISMMFSGATVTVFSRVRDDRAGLAGSMVNTAMETGPTAGLALLVSLATVHTNSLAAGGTGHRAAETAGYAFAFEVGAVTLACTAALALWLLREPRRWDG